MQPDISIIVPAANGRDVLFRCLESLLNQTFPPGKTELIIVDDKSDKRLEQSLKASECNKFLAFKYVPLSQKGPAVSRNAGIQNASSGIIAFIDDDCIADCDWIKWILEAHRLNPDKPVIGGLTYVSECDNMSLVSQFLGFGIMESGSDKKEIIFFSTCNVSIKKQIFLKHRFNENFSFLGGGGLEFFWSIFKQGHRFILDKNIKVVRCPCGGLAGFLKQAYYCGKGNLLTAYLHKGEHPLLKDLKLGEVSFWWSIFLGLFKIPGHGCLLCARLIKEEKIKPFLKKISIYFLIVLYRTMYLCGAVCEFYQLNMNKKQSPLVVKP